ncbi:hypothetical protein KQX54_018481 [Cotesia glomerata]|uniref:Uncharacterized protein n=1 Tax=Cotesia glomerata TaxID=32391 RepID=A0AAV7J2R0_COTGL|nr:hypothetical protein KQX54_018481 [Cotesia glomerata]
MEYSTATTPSIGASVFSSIFRDHNLSLASCSVACQYPESELPASQRRTSHQSSETQHPIGPGHQPIIGDHHPLVILSLINKVPSFISAVKNP